MPVGRLITAVGSAASMKFQVKLAKSGEHITFLDIYANMVVALFIQLEHTAKTCKTIKRIS